MALAKFGPQQFIFFLLTCALYLAGCRPEPATISPTSIATVAPTTPRPSRPPNPTSAPTATAKVIQVTPGADEVVCPRPETLPDTEVDISGPPFCIVWVDPFDDETGYRVHLDYFQSGERFIYEVGPDTEQLLLPEADAPHPEGPFEQCRNRQELTVTVLALRNGTTWPVNSMTMQTECGSVEDSDE